MNPACKALLALVYGGALCACTIVGPKYTPLQDVGPNRGTLYVYRPSNTDLGLMSALITVDGKQIASLENGGYTALAVEPGEHTITQQWKSGLLGNSDLEKYSISVKVNVPASHATYLRLASQATNLGSTSFNTVSVDLRWRLTEVPVDLAIPEISACRKVEPM